LQKAHGPYYLSIIEKHIIINYIIIEMRIVFIILWVCVFVLFSLLSCGYFDPFDSASGSSLFVTGGNKILTSVDGKSWTETNFFITECITEFVYVKDAFLAVDTDGYLWKSTGWKELE
jgi:hypothetical protein